MTLKEIKVPDIGDFSEVPVIEIMVKVGDQVEKEDSLITLESDKATMDVPSPVSGVIKSLTVNVGDTVSEGVLIASIETGQAAAGESPRAAETPAHPLASEDSAPVIQPVATQVLPPPISAPISTNGAQYSHATPTVRAYARELGVDIRLISGTGPKQRILKTDVQNYVKGIINGGQATTASSANMGVPQEGLVAYLAGLPAWPKVDFSKFGPIEKEPLSRIKKISGPTLARNWVQVPAVTYHDEADITELENLRKSINKEQAKAGIKLTMLAFIIKAVVCALKKYPALNGSLVQDELILKKYWHIGFAADTPFGLMVPVLKNADQKGVIEIAQETAEISKKAREGKLPPADMQGASFTISSLGGLGGTSFSPIVNAPELAILGVSRSAIKPQWDEQAQSFIPRLMMPLSLSADHRIIDGALATRFVTEITQLLNDYRRVLL